MTPQAPADKPAVTRHLITRFVLTSIACLILVVVGALLPIAYTQLLFDLFKGVAAPIAAVVIAIILLPRLLPHLPSLIERVQRLTLPGMTAEFGPGQQQKATSDSQTPPLVKSEEPPPSTEEPLPSTEVKTEPSQVAEEALIQASYALWAERLYRLIFGSQLQLLSYLKIVEPGGGASEDEVRKFYEDHAKLASAAGFPASDFPSWLMFVISWTTVAVGPDSRYQITPNGVWFLDYLSKNIPNAGKPF